MPEKIKEDFSSTGEEPSFETMKRSDELAERLIAARETWNARVREEYGKIILQYFADEACVKEVTLQYVESAWLRHGLGEACD